MIHKLHVGDCEHGRELTTQAKAMGIEVEVGQGDPYWHCASCAHERHLRGAKEALGWSEWPESKQAVE